MKGGTNLGGLRKGLNHLNSGGDLAIFGAGEVSGYNLKEGVWNGAFGKLSRNAKNIVPIWFSGPNHSFLYNLTSRIHYPMRNIFLLREFFNMSGKRIIMNVGTPISREELITQGIYTKPNEIAKYVRNRAETLRVKTIYSNREL